MATLWDRLTGNNLPFPAGKSEWRMQPTLFFATLREFAEGRLPLDELATAWEMDADQISAVQDILAKAKASPLGQAGFLANMQMWLYQSMIARYLRATVANPDFDPIEKDRNTKLVAILLDTEEKFVEKYTDAEVSAAVESASPTPSLLSRAKGWLGLS